MGIAHDQNLTILFEFERIGRMSNMCLTSRSGMALWDAQRLCTPFLWCGNEWIPSPFKSRVIALQSSNLPRKIYRFRYENEGSDAWSALSADFMAIFSKK